MSGLSFEVWVECLHLCVSSVNCMNDVYELYFDVCVGFFVGNIATSGAEHEDTERGTA